MCELWGGADIEWGGADIEWGGPDIEWGGTDIESAETNGEIIHVLHFKECEAHHSKFDCIFNVC